MKAISINRGRLLLRQLSDLGPYNVCNIHVGLKVIRNEQQNKSKIEILNLNETENFVYETLCPQPFACP